MGKGLQMKKASNVLLSLVLLSSSSLVSAAPLADFTLALKKWESGSDAMLGESSDSMLNYSYDDESSVMASFQIDHSIPLIPNIRFAYQSLDFANSNTLDQTFILNDTAFPVAGQLSTQHEILLQDTTLYYELIDISFVSLNVGVTGRYQDLDVAISESTQNLAATKNVNDYEIMGHARVNVDFPVFDFYAFAEVNKGSDSALNMMGVGYTFDNTILPDVSIEVGVIDQDVEFDLDDGLMFSQSFDSSYVGLAFSF